MQNNELPKQVAHHWALQGETYEMKYLCSRDVGLFHTGGNEACVGLCQRKAS
jgi:hypothetical protein